MLKNYVRKLLAQVVSVALVLCLGFGRRGCSQIRVSVVVKGKIK